MQLIDTHVHLDDTRYDHDREELIARAAAAGVSPLVTIGTDLADSVWAADFVAGRPGVFATVGHHPERVAEYDARRLGEYRAAAQRPGVVAIGEVGLDYHSPGFDAPAQQALLRQMAVIDLGEVARGLAQRQAVAGRAVDKGQIGTAGRARRFRHGSHPQFAVLRS